MHRPFAGAVRAATLAVALSVLPVAAASAAPAPPAADPPPAASGSDGARSARPTATSPTRGTRAFAGQADRWTVGGRWLIRRDLTGVGVQEHWERQASTEGWTSGTVPNTWTAGDNSAESMAGGITWYRRELRLPKVPKERSGGRWILRFERVAIAGTVWVNGKLVGRHRGAYEPFELRLPVKAARKDGTLTVVVRTDSRRELSDFPPKTTQKDGTPGGGWWNDGGIPREVILRYVDQFDLSPVQITPDLPCRKCSGRVKVRTTVTNLASGTRKADVIVRVGGRAKRLATVKLKSGEIREVIGTIAVAKPKLWSPKRPYLYVASVEATLRGGKRDGQLVSRFRARTGIRSVRVVRGRLQLNFVDVDLRGSGVHEMDVQKGSALTDRGQDLLLRQVQDFGGLVIRGHYPFHPRILEEADRLGLLVWTEIPVYQVRQSQIGKRRVRDTALRLLKTTIATNAYHPSVFTWSAGNELTTNPGPPIARYFQGARRVVDQLDPTRPLAYARQAGTKYGCISAYKPIDLIGLNDYFGWYGGPEDPLSDPAQLSAFLDGLRACDARPAIMITETGAEANRDGPVTEAGTYAFQAAYAAYHYAVYRSKPWLSGALWWGLREFRVRPNWAGGNPFPTPPWHAKGLLDLEGGKKPAWTVLHDELRGLDQLAPASTAPVAIPPSPPGRSSSDGTSETGDPAATPGDGAGTPGA